jgi:predicted dehydrogenase
MSQTSNQPAADAPIRVGLITSAECVEPYPAAIASCPDLRIVAASGMPQSAAPAEATWFDDTRALIAQSGVDAVLLATSPRAGIELGNVATAHALHVWRTPPIARSFAEATDAVQRARSAGVVYRVQSWWEHAAEEVRAALKLRESQRSLYTTITVRADGPPLQSWRSSLVDAGGGVLVTDAYPLLEALVAVRGLPDSLYAAIGKCRRAGGLAPRETEDVAFALLRYEGGGLVSLAANWDLQPFQWVCEHHSPEATVRIETGRVSIFAADHTLLHCQDLRTGSLTTELQRFAQAIRDRAAREAAAGTPERHIAVMALIETIYLAARTGQPEAPRKLYEVSKWPEPRR